MRHGHLPFVASVLLRLVASENPALAGDLEEERLAGRPARWFWRELVAAAASSVWAKRRGLFRTIRSITTTLDEPGAVALLDPSPMSLSGSRVQSVGGLGLLAVIVLITLVLPQAWFLVLAGLAGGVVLGIVLVRRGKERGLSGPVDGQPLGLFEPTPDGAPPAGPSPRASIRLERCATV